jgi:hypothetical protein
MNNESLYTSSDVVASNTSLRNLYQIGFNTKSLTKAVVGSINITQVCSKIKKLIDEDTVTIKTCGPLLLGISRVYGKKVKLYLEDIMTVLDIKKKEPVNDESVVRKKKKLPAAAGSVDLSTTMLSSSKKRDNLISMSPINDGLFNQLKERVQTPQKFNIDRLETPPMEIFRAGFPSSIQKNSFEEMKSYAEEGENFFKFISENTYSDQRPMDMDFDLNLDVNYDQPMPSHLRFSETKSLLEEFKGREFKEFTKLKPKKVDEEKRAKIGYDKSTNLDTDTLVEENVASINPSELMTKFKDLLLNKLEVGNIDLSKDADATFTNENYLNDLSVTFANLDVKEFNIETFNEKLTRILEEEEKVAHEEDEQVNDQPVVELNIEEDQPIQPDNAIEYNLEYPEEQNMGDDSAGNLNIREKIYNIVADNDIPFLDIRKKLESHNTADVFYNMLVMAQNRELEITQTEIFDNESIIASRIKN